jgi:hypothetical protein
LLDEGFDGYLRELEDNLLPGITPDLYADDYTAGAGGELQWEVRNGRRCPPKMRATYSSSALVVNSFALCGTCREDVYEDHANHRCRCDTRFFFAVLGTTS